MKLRDHEYAANDMYDGHRRSYVPWESVNTCILIDIVAELDGFTQLDRGAIEVWSNSIEVPVFVGHELLHLFRHLNTNKNYICYCSKATVCNSYLAKLC